MKDTERKRTGSFHRLLDLMEEHPPSNAVATTLVTELTTTTASIDAIAAEQDLAFGTVHGAVLDRKVLKKELVSFLKELGQTARVLDPVAHPGLASEMRLGRAHRSYGSLLIRARAYHTAMVPAKAAFVAFGSAPTVDADLHAMITALETASSRKNGGRAVHIGGTAGIASLCKRGVAIVRKLDAILSKVYKTDPVMSAAWKAARHVERNRTTLVSTPTPAPIPAPIPAPTSVPTSVPTSEPARTPAATSTSTSTPPLTPTDTPLLTSMLNPTATAPRTSSFTSPSNPQSNPPSTPPPNSPPAPALT